MAGARSGLLCSLCSRVTLCQEMFSATPACRGRRAVLRPWLVRRQRSQGVPLAGLAFSFPLEAKPSRKDCE